MSGQETGEQGGGRTVVGWLVGGCGRAGRLGQDLGGCGVMARG